MILSVGLHKKCTWKEIYFDAELVSVMMPKLEVLFVKVILPIVLRGFSEETATYDQYCFCQQGESGKMISCDATDCKFVWFHYTCVNLPYNYEPGDEEWLCPDCKKKFE